MRYPISLAAAICICLGACGKSGPPASGDDRFLGQWTFDRDYTQQHLPKEAKGSAEATPVGTPVAKGSPSEAAETSKSVNGILDNMVKPMLTEQLITQMDGQTFRLTPKLITDSSGQTRTYEFVERATPNDLSIKVSNGEIWTMSMEDGRIVMPTTGGVHFKLFFKRIGK